MKKLAKILSIALALVMILGVVTACNQTPDIPDTTPAPTPAPGVDPTPAPQQPDATPEPPASFNSKVPRDTLIIGTPPINGDFIDGWGNSTYDMDIKRMLGYHGIYAATVYANAEGQIVINNTIVQSYDTETDDEGNKTYTFTIHSDLVWNDGTPITADEYVAAFLLYASPNGMSAAGATQTAGVADGLVGNMEFRGGDEYFSGLKVLGDHQFSITLDGAELPFFWEMSRTMASPIPMHDWLPGISVISDENGSKFDGDISELAIGVAENQRYGPKVGAGPYSFVSFDGSTVTLQRNPNFKGDPYGNLPKFEWVIQMEVPEETDVDMVLAGDIDLNTGNIEGAKIEAALASEFGDVNITLRNGFGFIAFQVDRGPVADPNVRWAIAHTIDRMPIIDHVLEGYGSIVDAYYGLAQWEFQAARRELAQRLQPIQFNLELANDFLDKSDYRFEEDGSTAFDRSKVDSAGSYIRHNAEGEPLVVNHASGSLLIGGAIEAEAIKNAPLVGMRYEIDQIDFDTLLDHYYVNIAEEERHWHAYNLATNFTAVPDHYWYWHSDFVRSYNTNQMSDPQLDDLLVNLRSFDPTQTDEYLAAWIEFQVRWQELLPSIPLYSNQYYDIFNNVVISVPTTSLATYSAVICQIEKHP